MGGGQINLSFHGGPCKKELRKAAIVQKQRGLYNSDVLLSFFQRVITMFCIVSDLH